MTIAACMAAGRGPRRGHHVAAVLALWSLASGCGGSAPAADEAPAWSGRPVVLFTIDTTRADALGPWAEGPVSTPHVDRLAAEALVFERAYSQAGSTHPALMSMLSGLVPARHGVFTQTRRSYDGVVTAPQLMQAAGIPTAHFTANLCRFQDVPGTLFAEGWDTAGCGIDEDLEQYLWDRSVVDQAIEWIEGQGSAERPWFLWVHLIDPHFRHRPAPERWDYDRDPLADVVHEDKLLGRWEVEQTMPPAEVLAKLHALYAAEVSGADEQLGRV